MAAGFDDLGEEASPSASGAMTARKAFMPDWESGVLKAARLP